MGRRVQFGVRPKVLRLERGEQTFELFLAEAAPLQVLAHHGHGVWRRRAGEPIFGVRGHILKAIVAADFVGEHGQGEVDQSFQFGIRNDLPSSQGKPHVRL